MIGKDYVNQYFSEQNNKGSGNTNTNVGKKEFTATDIILTLFTGGFWLIVWFLKK